MAACRWLKSGLEALINHEPIAAAEMLHRPSEQPVCLFVPYLTIVDP